MTALLYGLVASVLIFGLYVASKVDRTSKSAETFLDAGSVLPNWILLFCLPGLVAVGFGLERQIMLIGQFGLQANHVAVGIVLVAITAMLIWNRFWLISRVFGTISPSDLMGKYYNSEANGKGFIRNYAASGKHLAIFFRTCGDGDYWWMAWGNL